MIRDLIPFTNRAPHSMDKDPFTGFRKAMNQVFENFERDLTEIPQLNWNSSLGSFTPKLDLEEKDDKLIICAELPGLTEKDVQVELNKDLLTIKGEKKFQKENKTDDRYFSERKYGSFHRVIKLGNDLVKDKIDATVKDGVLTVTIPKSTEAQRDVKKIPVRH